MTWNSIFTILMGGVVIIILVSGNKIYSDNQPVTDKELVEASKNIEVKNCLLESIKLKRHAVTPQDIIECRDIKGKEPISQKQIEILKKSQ